MAIENYYKVLDVAHDATLEQLKKAYRSAARECHPDRFPDDTEAKSRFERLGRAHAVLSNSSKRKRHDRQIKVPQSVQELFAQFPTAQQVVEDRLPKASAAMSPGIHLLGVLEVSPEILKEGGEVILPSFGDEGPKAGSTLTVPRGADKHNWVCFDSQGGLGVNGAEAGDFYLIVVPKRH